MAIKAGHEDCPRCQVCGLTDCPDCDTEGRCCPIDHGGTLDAIYVRDVRAAITEAGGTARA